MPIKLIYSKYKAMKRLNKTSMFLIVISVATTLPYQFHYLASIK